MPDEQKAEEYTDSINTLIYDIEDNAINIAKYLRKAYLDGLAEGRKELVDDINSLKKVIRDMVNAFNNYECSGPVQEQENTWETLRDLMHDYLYKMEGKIK